MRIALVNSLLPPVTVGGAGRSVAELADELRAAGHEVRTLSLAPTAPEMAEEHPDARRLKDDQIVGPIVGTVGRSRRDKAMWHAGEWNRTRAARFLRENLVDQQPDVVNFHNLAGFGFAGWRVAADYPVVQTLRDYYLTCVKSSRFRDQQSCVSTCLECTVARAPFRLPRWRPQAFVGISERVLQVHREAGVIRDEPTYVVANQPRMDPVPPREPDGTHVFGFIGRVAEEKGVDLLVRAFAGLPPSVDARLVIAGQVDERVRQRLVRAGGAGGRVHFIGHVPARDFYGQVDTVVVPSQWEEPFGRVAAEAVSAGRPVIASAIGGLSEAAGRQGVFVAPHDDVGAWQKVLAEAVGRVASPSATPAFRPTVGRQYVEIYDAVIRSGARIKCR